MVTTHQSRREARLQRRLVELRAWRNIYEQSVPDWTMRYPDGRGEPMTIGSYWKEVALPVEFDAHTKVPEAWRGRPVDLELWLGGEGLVQISTGFQGGLNPVHHRFPVVDEAKGGEPVEIHAEVVPKGIFGANILEPRLERAALVVPNQDVRALERDLAMIAEACAVLNQHEVVPFLLDAVEKTFSVLAPHWPTSTEESVTRYVKGYHDGLGSGTGAVPTSWVSEAIDNRRLTDETWSLPEPPADFAPLSDAAQQAVRDARGTLAAALDQIEQDYPPVGRLCITGHAHIDLAWLWPLAETRRKIRRTFSTVLDLMDRFPDFTFNQSSAQAYAWIAEDDPEVFERIQQRVAEGRWEPVGGMWVESDANVTGGEAFVRQLLYGQRYFEATFGKRCTVVWLPDVFGYSGGMPQLMRGAGLDSFFTTKLNWNEANTFPFDLFEWEGIDGSSVTAHTFFNPGQGYNGNIVPFDTKGTWDRFRGKTRHNESLFAFGWGDGAGGPTDKMLENYARIKNFPALPRLRMGNVREFFSALPTDGLPKAVGELYLELHRGTLTTQAKVKENNRKGEQRLLETEIFSAIASLDGYDYPADQLETSWKTLLLNQFHDILPGSSISEVYVDSHRQMEEVIELAECLRDRVLALGKEPSATIELIVANAALYPRPLTVLVPPPLTESLDAAAGLLSQSVDAGVLVTSPGAIVPGLGSSTLRSGNAGARIAPVSASTSDEGFVLENLSVRVTVGPDGTLHGVFDKEANREVLIDRSNQLWAYVDKPYSWDAWDIDESYARDGEEIVQVERLGISETGPIRGAVTVSRSWRGSTITQTYQLWHDSKRIDIVTNIDWHERQVLLKTHFPLAIRSDHATFETMYGAVTRPTHRNSPWDAARFEGCGHRFGDLSEPGYGAAILNDAKYGYEALGSDLMLSLLRSPLYPDPLADEGAHHFTYSLLPHIGNWTESSVVQEAFALNSPLIVSTGVERASFVEAEGLPLSIGALKRAEDGNGLILRTYEPHGARGNAVLRFGRPVQRVFAVDLLEDPIGESTEIAIEANAISLDFRPFEVKSLRMTMA
ncbi:MAG TPA: alpha-mannosidase [Thermomicrobiales bacterium]|nr:alpha-mannosidase [Thermomicrobiales bacterium]